MFHLKHAKYIKVFVKDFNEAGSVLVYRHQKYQDGVPRERPWLGDLKLNNENLEKINKKAAETEKELGKV